MFSKLCRKLSEFSGSTRHVVLMYGSSSGAGNCLFTDVDMMAFVDDNVCTPDKVSELKGLFERTMVEEGFLLDDEIPLERKLLVSLSVARAAAGTRCQIEVWEVIFVEKSRAFLKSDTMLECLIFNVLSVPTGDVEPLSLIRATEIINAIAKYTPFTAEASFQPH